MDIEEFRIALADHMKDYFADFAFALIEGDVGGYALVHENEDIRLTIRFQKAERLEGTEFGRGTEYIQFKKVEAIWLPLCVKHKLYVTATPPVTLDETFRHYNNSEEVMAFSQRLITHLINRKEDIPAYSEVLKEYLEQISFPFFEKYSKLEALNEFINTTDDMANADHFTPPHVCRKIIIKKLCNDPGYESYLQHWINYMTAGMEGEDGHRYVPYVNAIQELKIVLEKY